jgi:hypothetical protein
MQSICSGTYQLSMFREVLVLWIDITSWPRGGEQRAGATIVKRLEGENKISLLTVFAASIHLYSALWLLFPQDSVRNKMWEIHNWCCCWRFLANSKLIWSVAYSFPPVLHKSSTWWPNCRLPYRPGLVPDLVSKFHCAKRRFPITLKYWQMHGVLNVDEIKN